MSIPPLSREWQAWQVLCRRLKTLGVDINKENRLAAELRLWGEELVTLRDLSPEYKEKALREARDESSRPYTCSCGYLARYPICMKCGTPTATPSQEAKP